MPGANPHTARRRVKANDSIVKPSELDTMKARAAEAARLRTSGDVPHYQPDGMPLGLEDYVALCRAGRVASARFTLRPVDS